MTTRIVGGTITAPDGQALNSVQVDFELVLAEAFVVVGSLSLAGKLSIQTASDGTWSTPLQCNDDLTPVGTLYQVTEKIPSQHGGAKVYLIQVLTGLPVSPTINQVLNLIVPAAVPVGGSYSPVGSGPTGPIGPTGPPGYVVVVDNAALNALTKIEGLPIWVANTECGWIWNGSFYDTHNIPRFLSQAAADAAFNSVAQNKSQPFYLQTNIETEGPLWRNSNNSYTKPWNMPWGQVGYAPGAGSGALTTTPFNMMSMLNVPLIRRRRYMFNMSLRAVLSPSACSVRATLIGAVPPAVLPNTTLGVDHYVSVQAGNIITGFFCSVPFNVTVDGNFSFNAALAVMSGTGTYYADSGGYINIMDLGPYGAPV